MDIRKQIERAYRAQTASKLRLSLLEFSAIESYDQGKYDIPNSRNDLFEKLVSRIVSEFTSQNDIDEDFIEQNFGCDNYEKSEELKCLLYYEAGKRLSQREDMTLKELANLYDNVYRSLFFGLSLRHEQISSLIDLLKNDFENEVLLRSRIFHNSGDQALKELHEIYNADATEESIISKIDIYNDGAYTELPLAVDAISYICQLHGFDDLWFKLFDVLRYFPLQGSMLYQIRTINGYIDLLKHESGRPHSKVTSRIALDKFLRLLCDIPERLVSNRDSKVLNDEQHTYCSRLFDQWNDKYNELVSEASELLIESLGVVDFVSWLSRELRRVEGMSPQYAIYPSSALKVMRKVADKHASEHEYDLSECSIDSLLYYANLADTQSEAYCKALADEICKRAYSGQWVQTILLTDDGFAKLRSIYYLLIRANMDGMELMYKYRKPDEGYAVDPKASMSIHYGDNFWLPVLVLQHENYLTVEKFKNLLNFLFNRINKCSIISFDDYFTSFYLSELIVTQILPDLKNEFESALINNVSDLVFVLRVLTANEGNMDNGIVKELKTRISAEWQYEKVLYSKRNQDQIRFLEEYLNKL